MRIARLEMQRVGVFEDETIEFRPKTDPDKAEIHILTGVNGSGKSTILYTLAAAFLESEFIKRRFHDKNASQANLECQNSVEPPAIAKFGLKDGAFIYKEASPSLAEYRLLVTNRNNPGYQDHKLDFAVFAYSGVRSLSSFALSSIQELTVSPLEGSLDFYKSVDPQVLLQWIANTKAKVAFARQDNDQQLAERYENAVRRIEETICDIVGYPVEFVFSYEPLAVRIKVRSQELEFDVLPDGLKSIISWIADLLMRLDRLRWVDNTPVLDRSFILFLDEIEIHLHPAWQRRILPVVQKLFKNAQIFIATHSPFVVASVSDAWIYKFVVKDGKSKLESVEESKAGTSYPAVLDEVFGIDEYFDVTTEEELDTFEKLKQKLLKGDRSVLEALEKTARQLSEKSVEVQDIVGRELRQLQRITGETIEL